MAFTSLTISSFLLITVNPLLGQVEKEESFRVYNEGPIERPLWGLPYNGWCSRNSSPMGGLKGFVFRNRDFASGFDKVEVGEQVRLAGHNYKYTGGRKFVKAPSLDGAPFELTHSYPLGEGCSAGGVRVKIVPKVMEGEDVSAIVTAVHNGQETTQTVSVGDLLLVEGNYRKVLSIVPPKPEAKKFGWLDLSQAHIPKPQLETRLQWQKDYELPAQFLIKHIQKPFNTNIHDVKFEDGEFLIKGFHVWTWDKMGCTVRFPVLKHDHLVRIEGLDYKVDLEGHYTERKCVRQSSKSKPPEPTVSLPIVKGEYTSRLQGYSLMLHIPDEELKNPTSKMKVTVRLHRQDTKTPDKVEQSVSVGDILYVNSYPYKVLGVIPPDPKAKRIGSLDISKLPTNYRKPSKTTPPVISDKTKEK